MSEYAKLGSLMQDQVDNSVLHPVLFTQNATLRSSIHQLVLSTESAEISVADMVNEYASLENNTEEFSSQFATFNQIADAFAARLKDGAEILKGIRDEVSTLCEAASERISIRIAEDPVLAKICNVQKDLKLENVGWEHLDSVDMRSIKYALHDAARIDADREITPGVLHSIINQLDCANAYNKVELNKISLNQDVFDRVVGDLHKFMKDESREVIAGMFRNLLEYNTTSCLQSVTAANNFLSGNSAADINRIMHISAAYKKMFAVMTPETLDLAASTMEELNKHISSMTKFVNTMLYIASYYRDVVWTNAVIVPGPFCNTDNMEAYEGKGGTMTQLVQHNVRFYQDKDLPVPTKGISGEFVLQSSERLENDFAKEAAAKSKTINKTKADIERAAFIITATNYLNGCKDLSNKFSMSKNLTQYAASIYDSMKNSPMEDKFYKLIFNAKHIGTIVPEIYSRLSKAYTDYAAKVGNISEESCEELDIAVYSDMISEYLVDQGILVI